MPHYPSAPCFRHPQLATPRMSLITLLSRFCTGVQPCALVCGCLLAFSFRAAHAQGVTYALDATHTRVHWEVMHLGTSTSRGRFGEIQGSLTLDEATASGEVSISIATASVDTGVAPLDGVLRRQLPRVSRSPAGLLRGTRLEVEERRTARSARRAHAARRVATDCCYAPRGCTARATPCWRARCAVPIWPASCCAVISASPTTCPSSPTGCGW